MKHTWYVLLGLSSLSSWVGCNISYELGPTLDALPPEVAADGGELVPRSRRDAADAGMPALPLRGIPFPCERWGAGAKLASPRGAVLAAVEALWGGSSQQDLDEAWATYGGVLEGGTSGDLHCVTMHMLENNRAVRGVGHFYDTWLRLDQLPEKDPKAFADYPPARVELMARDARDFAVDVTLRGEKNFQRLFTTQRPLTITDSWRDLSLKPDGARLSAGLLTEPGVLATLGTLEVSATWRGVWVRTTFLCDPLPPSPDGQTPTLPEPEPGDSYRQRVERATSEPACVGCHQLVDPMGFALDPFDVVGQVHPLDREGRPFVMAGRVDLPEGSVTFDGPAALGARLADSPSAHACFARHWLAHISLHPPETVEPDDVDVVARALQASGGGIKFMIAAAFERLFQR